MLDENSLISFFPSVNKNKYLEYEAGSGAVLSITATASTLSRALKNVYSEMDEISFAGLTYRKDICKI